MQHTKSKKSNLSPMGQLGLQTLKAVVILLMFFAMSMFFASQGANALEESLTTYQDAPQRLFGTVESNF